MDTVEIALNPREVLGKKVKQMRRQGIIPTHLYGHGVDSLSLQGDSRALLKALAQAGKTSLVALNITGQPEARMAFVRKVQRDPKSQRVIHIDFFQVNMAEKLSMEVPLSFVGDSQAAQLGLGVLFRSLNQVLVECLPSDIPKTIEVDLSVLAEVGKSIHVKDLKVDPKITILTDPEQVVAQVVESRYVEEVVAVAAEAAPAEGEAKAAEEGAAGEGAAAAEKKEE